MFTGFACTQMFPARPNWVVGSEGRGAGPGAHRPVAPLARGLHRWGVPQGCGWARGRTPGGQRVPQESVPGEGDAGNSKPPVTPGREAGRIG